MPPINELLDIQALNLVLVCSLAGFAVRWCRKVNAALETLDRTLVEIKATRELLLRDVEARLARLERRVLNGHTAA